MRVRVRVKVSKQGRKKIKPFDTSDAWTSNATVDEDDEAALVAVVVVSGGWC